MEGLHVALIDLSVATNLFQRRRLEPFRRIGKHTFPTAKYLGYEIELEICILINCPPDVVRCITI